MGLNLDLTELDEALDSETPVELREERRHMEAENPIFTGAYWLGFLGIVSRACKTQVHQFHSQCGEREREIDKYLRKDFGAHNSGN